VARFSRALCEAGCGRGRARDGGADARPVVSVLASRRER
jgi:hypothetical protein